MIHILTSELHVLNSCNEHKIKTWWKLHDTYSTCKWIVNVKIDKQNSGTVTVVPLAGVAWQAIWLILVSINSCRWQNESCHYIPNASCWIDIALRTFATGTKSFASSYSSCLVQVLCPRSVPATHIETLETEHIYYVWIWYLPTVFYKRRIKKLFIRSHMDQISLMMETNDNKTRSKDFNDGHCNFILLIKTSYMNLLLLI